MTDSDRETGRWQRAKRKLPLVFVGMLILGTIGTIASDVRWVEAVANHLWGLGVVGLLACLAAYIAGKKHRDPRRAFLLGAVLPVVLGIIAVILVYLTTGFVYCGGGVILATALLVIIAYSCMWKRPAGEAIS